VEFRELSIPGAYSIRPIQRADPRGVFLEWFQGEGFVDALGFPFRIRQANTSVSKRGVLRGIHFADLPPGQAKYVTVMRGTVLDFAIDLRVGSPTFGRWDSVLLDDVDRHAVYLAEGLGHAFLALSAEATVSYLVSEAYRPDREHGIHALDPELGLVFPDELGAPILSDKDAAAPSLQEMREAGRLPDWNAAQALYEAHRREGS
jgi:dTDP-4-dehydrorhamnose 3,5-epimerase